MSSLFGLLFPLLLVHSTHFLPRFVSLSCSRWPTSFVGWAWVPLFFLLSSVSDLIAACPKHWPCVLLPNWSRNTPVGIQLICFQLGRNVAENGRSISHISKFPYHVLQCHSFTLHFLNISFWYISTTGAIGIDKSILDARNLRCPLNPTTFWDISASGNQSLVIPKVSTDLPQFDVVGQSEWNSAP